MGTFYEPGDRGRQRSVVILVKFWMSRKDGVGESGVRRGCGRAGGIVIRLRGSVPCLFIEDIVRSELAGIKIGHHVEQGLIDVSQIEVEEFVLFRFEFRDP
jgi:hypothetical protein